MSVYQFGNETFPLITYGGRTFIQPRRGYTDEVLRWNALNAFFSGREWFSIREFPLLWQAVLMSGHIRNMHRVGLVTFFLGNGLAPWTIRELFDSISSLVSLEGRSHIDYLIDNPPPYRYYDMTLGRYDTMSLPGGGRVSTRRHWHDEFD